MFKKILIANRGEIACRVIKTCSQMGINTVAVFSDPDRNARHVAMADESVCIGSSEAKNSYLSVRKIVNACKRSGADAVHPGYGFLSENSNFCLALKEVGITFIGPSAEAIDVMGDKIKSKKIAANAGVSTIPGFLGVVESSIEAVKIANEVGFPVMIKASAGGGGKGMRIAWNEDEVLEGFVLSQNEAKKSFGDNRMFIEKYIERPRHIEIQILGDTFGNYVSFGERECSIQRRNQKIIEEAPSPFLIESVRREMEDQAIALAREVGYVSAGTVEFIVDASQNFYFLEMNTRLQVEHPVTELIYDIDLVKEMITIAGKQPISYSQNDLQINGWAIESRIYAEDPVKNFLPSIGRLSKYSPPKESFTQDFKVRNDSGVHEGVEISLYYDPMIGKLCVWAPTRKIAIEKMQQALDSFIIDGVETNLNFLSAVLSNKKFSAGNFSTAFILEEYPDGFNNLPIESGMVFNFAVVGACMYEVLSSRMKRNYTDNFEDLGETLVRVAKVNNFDVELILQKKDRKTFILIGLEKNDLEVKVHWLPGRRLVDAIIGSIKLKIKVKVDKSSFHFEYRGHQARVQVFNRREAELYKFMKSRLPEDVSKFVLCPMPGLLVDLQVSAGEEVSEGQALCTIEAMKMENILKAEKNGTIKVINKKIGDSLDVNEVIIEFD